VTDDVVPTRKCGNCEEEKPVTEFYRDGEDPDGNTKYRRDCKLCYKITRSEEMAAKKAKAKAKEKE
jgi:hypothetical protein